MKYLEFKTPTENLKLSRIAYGSNHFGWLTDYENAEKLLDCYLALGGNLLDTARCAEYHRSEEFIGAYFRKHPERRKDVYICTKWGNPVFNKEHTGVERFRFSKADFEADLAESLRLLQTACIDIHLLHKYSPDLDVTAIIEMMNEPVKDGRVRHIGVSNWPVEAIQKANDHAEKHGLQKFEFSEVSHSLYVGGTEGWGEVEMIHVLQRSEIAQYQKMGITVLCFSAQAGGFFFKNHGKPSEEVIDKRNKPENIERLKRVNALCQARNLTPQQVVFGFISGQDCNAISIITSKSTAHLTDALQAADTILTKQDVSYLLGEETLK